MRAHIIENGRVANTIEVEDLDVFPGLLDADLGGQIGDYYDEAAGTFTTPAAPVQVPEEVTRRQGLQALYLNGVSRTDVLAFINEMQDETARGLALIEYEEATTFRIDNQLVIAAAAHFNLDLTALFIQANSL
ncbi:hypothetical protein GTP44_03760 [Duganella sp. FT50W]|uniref:Uncharacterized protein n=1 Tax=Duganella lactea TaxID=2692173 RepID=A0A6L8MH61_9BURK|nr:hypothetical protein [Duganella lactea]MYM81076.1 hypothetical protein [Duganella lactea]